MKDRKTASLLAIFAGGIGAHRFYLGENGKGILNILICWTFIPAILGMFTGIKWLLGSDESFDRAYNSERIQREQMRIQRETLEALKTK
jgi:TM2 domain-containing membrane protein YozV